MSANIGLRRMKPPCFVELSDLKDLARLTCAFEKMPIPIFSFDHNNDAYLATQIDMFMGRLILYYVKAKGEKHFLGYKNSGGVEEVILSDSPLFPAYIYTPIIHFKKLPKLFQKGFEPIKGKMDKFISIQVRDIVSLAKVSSYKVLFEEPPLPLFSFKSDDKNIIGAFIRMNEMDENSIFFYTIVDESPTHNFIKYSALKVGEVGFTNRVDEHGNIYIKIIKLTNGHPLVELEI
ncbi:MAG: hypothetical protein H3Z53_04095 [archaeon]|nr:hypothetical protein [archaeon]MCP8313540.1 hypothetical protein [archaeon]MCP8321921.1 hypothetical protein [archaeon]